MIQYQMIIQMDVTDKQNDIECLESNINAVKEQIELTPKTVLADKGYGNEDHLKNLSKIKNLEVVVPIQEYGNQKSLAKKGITFKHSEKEDCYFCSEGKKLKKTHNCVKDKGKYYNKYQGIECEGCPRRSDCTKSKKGKVLSIRINSEFIIQYKKNLESDVNQAYIKRRKSIVEHPFGTLKKWMGQIPLKLRGKQKVQTEIDLYSISYNFKRLISVESYEILMQKLINWA